MAYKRQFCSGCWRRLSYRREAMGREVTVIVEDPKAATGRKIFKLVEV